MVLLLWVLQGRALEWAHCGGQARGHSRRGTCREPRRLQQLEPTRWLHRSRDPVALSDLRPAVDPELLWAGHRRPIFMPRPPPRHGRSLGRVLGLLHVLDAVGEQVKRTLHRTPCSSRLPRHASSMRVCPPACQLLQRSILPKSLADSRSRGPVKSCPRRCVLREGDSPLLAPACLESRNHPLPVRASAPDKPEPSSSISRACSRHFLP